ncbi:MAG: RluA family pseudouridine synthase [Candidatus Berkelbacteria bacterium]|nr:RluA family pseudouridine synthase [Candidatus Berkelbacteria bacterium]MCR4307688.1 RluA family pseudouridine synthase [Candidatus Berkelbacteria bacterium]
MQPTLITENSDYYVINKPAGYSVEPHLNYPSISDWLNTLYDIYAIKDMDRYGIVHRLDVETSGVLIWAKNELAQKDIQKTWQGRAVKKTYLALVTGEVQTEGGIELAIERDNRNDRQRVVLLPSLKARPAITNYTRLAVGEWEKEKVSLVECHPVTGRTHQIRVHLQSIGHPIIGDRIYGSKLSGKISDSLNLHRQFLHAWKIELDDTQFIAPPPEDLVRVLQSLKINLPS